MTIVTIDHIAVIVDDIDAALSHFRQVFDVADKDLVYHRNYRDVDPDTGAMDVHHIASIRVGKTFLELTEPVSDGPLKDFLERTGGGVHHIGITSDGIVSDWRRHAALRETIGLIDSRPRVDEHGVSYWFLHPKKNYRTLLEVDAAWQKTSAGEMTPVETPPAWQDLDPSALVAHSEPEP